MVDAPTWQALLAVEGLKHGEAKESCPVTPAPDDCVEAVQLFVTPPIWAMIEIQLWSSARPGEVCAIRTCDIHQQHPKIPKAVAGLCWIYIPPTHKTEHHGKERFVLLGPQAQRILEPWLRPDMPEACLFSPAEGRAWFQAKRRANRKTPMTPSQRGRTKEPNPERAPGNNPATSYRKGVCSASLPVFYATGLQTTLLSAVRPSRFQASLRWHTLRCFVG